MTMYIDGRYVINPDANYRCPYCNEPARLRDKDVVVDSYSNTCHIARFDREIRTRVLSESGKPEVKNEPHSLS